MLSTIIFLVHFLPLQSQVSILLQTVSFKPVHLTSSLTTHFPLLLPVAFFHSQLSVVVALQFSGLSISAHIFFLPIFW